MYWRRHTSVLQGAVIYLSTSSIFVEFVIILGQAFSFNRFPSKNQEKAPMPAQLCRADTGPPAMAAKVSRESMCEDLDAYLPSQPRAMPLAQPAIAKFTASRNMQGQYQTGKKRRVRLLTVIFPPDLSRRTGHERVHPTHQAKGLHQVVSEYFQRPGARTSYL